MTLRLRRLILGLVLSGLLVLGAVDSATGTPARLSSVVRLRVDAMPSPATAASLTPSFSWSLAGEPGAEVRSWHLTVSEAWTAAVVWSSTQDVSANVSHYRTRYGGPPLATMQRYTWAVTCFSSDGTSVSSNSSALFYTPTAKEDWESSRWIAGAYVDTEAFRTPNNLLRTSFNVSGASPIANARAYIAGLGFFHLFVNSVRVSDVKLQPGWTQYIRRVEYVVHDVTALIQGGRANGIGVMLGMAWRDGVVYPSEDEFPPPVTERCLRMIVVIDFEDGTRQTVETGEGWETGEGPVVYDSLYNGEWYDARLERPGWASAQGDGGSWAQAAVVWGPPGVLSPSFQYPIRVTQIIETVRMTEPSPATYVYDFGVNFAGAARLRVKGPRGTRVVLKFAEKLHNPPHNDGNIDMGSLRVAKATDTYILKGDPDGEVYEPFFAQHGFQFVQMTGYPGEPTLDTLSGLHYHTAAPRRGGVFFTGGSAHILNAVQRANEWAIRSNMMSLPTDCPQRDERLGWMGDASVTCDMRDMTFDTESFDRKFLQDIRDEQNKTGAVPEVVPFVKYGQAPPDPTWSGAYPQFAYTLLLYFGDTDTALDHLPMLVMYTNHWKGICDEYTMKNMFFHQGDWIPPPPNAKINPHELSSFDLVHNTEQVAFIARHMGDTATADRLDAMAADFRTEFHDTFYANGSYAGGMQGELGLPLYLGNVNSPSEYQLILDKLTHDILMENDGHVTSGQGSTKYLFLALCKWGRHDLAVGMLEKTDYPGWGYMLYNDLEPATSIWERMDAPFQDNTMNSRNHHAWAQVGAAVYEYFLGLRPDPNGRLGFVDSIMEPGKVLAVTAASGYVEAAHGNVTLSWERSGATQCGRAQENGTMEVTCGAEGGTIEEVVFASFGQPVGTCGDAAVHPSCYSEQSHVLAVVQAACVGKAECAVVASQAVLGNIANATHVCRLPLPNHDTPSLWGLVQVRCSVHTPTLRVHAGVPVGGASTVIMPVGAAMSKGALITVNDAPVWKDNAFIAGVPGVVAGHEDPTTHDVLLRVLSGQFDLHLTTVLASLSRLPVVSRQDSDDVVTLACASSDAIIDSVTFASYGLPHLDRTTGVPHRHAHCHTPSALRIARRHCVGRRHCRIALREFGPMGSACRAAPASLRALLLAHCFSKPL